MISRRRGISYTKSNGGSDIGIKDECRKIKLTYPFWVVMMVKSDILTICIDIIRLFRIKGKNREVFSDGHFNFIVHKILDKFRNVKMLEQNIHDVNVFVDA